MKKLYFLLFFLSFNHFYGQIFPNPADLATGQGPAGSNDPLWLISELFDSNPPNPIGLNYTPALINNNCAPGAWVSPSSLPPPTNNGNWITSSTSPCATNNLSGYIYYRLTLDLPASCNGNSVATSGNYKLFLSCYVDNDIIDVFVNGVSKGISGGGYAVNDELDMQLTGPWNAGINYIDILVYNLPGVAVNPYGLLVVANYSVSLSTDTDGDGFSDLIDKCPCEVGILPEGCPCPTPIPTGSSTQTFCSNATIADLTAVGNNVKWYLVPVGGNPLASSAALVNGNNYYASQTAGGCESERLAVTAQINVTPPPTGDSLQHFCRTASVLDLQAGTNNVEWFLTPVGGVPLATNSAINTGTIYYAEQTISGCKSVSRLPVTAQILNPVANPVARINVCAGSNTNYNLNQYDNSLLGSQSASLFAVSYFSSNQDAVTNSNPVMVFPDTAGTTTIFAKIFAIADETCFAITNFQIQTFNPPVILDFPDKWYICSGESLKITAPPGFNAYEWSTGQTTPRITVDATGTYSLKVSYNYSEIACSTTVSFTVIASEPATINNIEIQDWTDYENMLTVDVTGNGDYEFSLDNINFQDSPVFSGLATGIYTVYVNDKNGCGPAKAEAVILNYPKFFTPNGDGINDIWKVKFSWYESPMVTSIFDRYGKLLTRFESDEPGWNGKYNGAEMPSNDYWFLITRQDGREFRGHFSLKR